MTSGLTILFFGWSYLCLFFHLTPIMHQTKDLYSDQILKGRFHRRYGIHFSYPTSTTLSAAERGKRAIENAIFLWPLQEDGDWYELDIENDDHEYYHYFMSYFYINDSGSGRLQPKWMTSIRRSEEEAFHELERDLETMVQIKLAQKRNHPQQELGDPEQKVVRDGS